jgi:hypothetical protein
MEEMTFEGKIEDIAVKPKKTGGDYLKLKVSGKTFNFFDIGFYEKNKANFKIGSVVSIIFMTNTFTADDGTERTSNTANAIAFDGIKADSKAFMPEKPIQKPVADFVQASQTTQTQEDSIETIMKNCLRIAMEITQKYRNDEGNDYFNTDNVTSICNSMFIEVCKRRR